MELYHLGPFPKSSLDPCEKDMLGIVWVLKKLFYGKLSGISSSDKRSYESDMLKINELLDSLHLFL